MVEDHGFLAPWLATNPYIKENFYIHTIERTMGWVYGFCPTAKIAVVYN